MKYIDAEKLIAILERQNADKKIIQPLIRIIDSIQQEQDLIVINKKDWEAQEQFRKNKDFGKSLQKKQPEVDIKKIIEQTYHDGSVADTDDIDHVTFENIALHFFELGQAPNTSKPAEFAKLTVKDLKKEIDSCWQNWISPSNQKEVEGVLPKTEFTMYARHFYELGLNASKEENK